MDAASREVEDIACLDLMVGQHLCDRAVFNPFLIFVGCDGVFETRIEVGAFVGLDDIPHLRFAHLTVFAHGHLVVRMDLNAEVALSINELHQQGELTMIFVVDSYAEDFFGMLIDDRYQVFAFPWSIANDAGAGRHCADFPTFADRLRRGFLALVKPELVATPYHWMQIRFKKKRI